eukprot:1145010-Pelagomonas_calceolata.AAC.2
MRHASGMHPGLLVILSFVWLHTYRAIQQQGWQQPGQPAAPLCRGPTQKFESQIISSGPEEDEELDAVAEEVEEQQQQEARARETRAKEAAAKAGGHRDHWQGVGDDAEEGVDGEEEEEEEEEEHPLVEASLMLSEMRQQMSVVDDLVRNYARSIGFSVHEFESASERLRTVRAC